MQRRTRSPIPEQRTVRQRTRSPVPEFALRRHYDPQRKAQYSYEQVAAAPFIPEGRVPPAINERLHNIFFFKPDFYRDLGAAATETEIRWAIFLIRMRAAFKRLLTTWLRRRCERVALPTTDPISLAEFERPVVIYDMAGRSRYQFEAQGLMVHIKNQLHNVNYGFPQPIIPRNPLTNLPFSLGQLVSIHTQLLTHGRSYWAFSALMECEGHLGRFFQLHEPALRKAAVQSHVFGEMNAYSAEEFHDFIATYSAFHGLAISATDHIIIQYAIQYQLDNDYINCWRRLYVVALMHNIVSEPQPTLSDTPVVASHKKAVSLMARILAQNIRGFIAEVRPAYTAHSQTLTHNIIQQIFGVDFGQGNGAGSLFDDDEGAGVPPNPLFDDDDEDDT